MSKFFLSCAAQHNENAVKQMSLFSVRERLSERTNFKILTIDFFSLHLHPKFNFMRVGK